MLRRQVTQPAAHSTGECTEHPVHRQRAATVTPLASTTSRSGSRSTTRRASSAANVVLPTPPIPCRTSPAAPGPSSSVGQRRCSRRRPTNSPTWRASSPAGNRGLTGAGAPSVVVAAGSSRGATPERDSTVSTAHSPNAPRRCSLSSGESCNSCCTLRRASATAPSTSSASSSASAP